MILYRYFRIGLHLVRVECFDDGLPQAAELFDPQHGAGFTRDNRWLTRIAGDDAEVEELSAVEFAAEVREQQGA